jgi:hypothetical protein
MALSPEDRAKLLERILETENTTNAVHLSTAPGADLNVVAVA